MTTVRLKATLDAMLSRPTNFCYVDGRAEPVDWTEPTVREAITEERGPLDVCRKLTPRERRLLARAGTRGRRGSRRVSVWGVRISGDLFFHSWRIWVGHAFQDACGRRLRLYLPESVAPSEEHARTLDEAIRLSAHRAPP